MTDLLAPYLDAQGRITRFDITEDEVRTGLKDGMDLARARIAAIKAEANPDFENTITALEVCDEEMSFISSIFFNMLSVMSTDARQALAQEIGPILSAFRNELTLDPDLFAKVDAVYQNRKNMDLSAEEAMLLENTWQGFTRNGARLNDKDKARLKEIDARQSQLTPQYSDNCLKATNDYIYWADEAEVQGLPETALAQARATAKEKGGEKEYAITLHAPSIGPALTYLDDRDLREKLWRVSATLAFGGPNDNSANVLEIADLRRQRAKLLGFNSHAAYVLDRRMAKTVDRVKGFIADLAAISKPKAENELEELRVFSGLEELKPWDLSYYSEKLRQSRYAFSSEDFRPYFPLQHALTGTFKHFEKLFGVRFVSKEGLATWHEDVQVFAVTDEKTGDELGLLYADFHPRETKRSGAWMTDYRGAGLFRGKVERPIVAIVCNFTKPAEGKPSLLTFDEVETLFHEMGHAMHGLLAQGRHPSLTGTNVLWDFVELPSQIQENWLQEDETLALVARHYETGAAIPRELIDKMRAAQTFQSGLFNLRQLTLGTIDMAWHTLDKEVADMLAFERKATEHLSLMPYIAGARSTSFGHIFSGGYSAGYYSYLWAEVLDADAFDLFKEKGLYDQATASSYRKNILEKGGSEEPMSLFVAFRGREPDPKAMLRRKGLLEAA